MWWKYAGSHYHTFGCSLRPQRATEKVVSLRCMIRLNRDQSLNYCWPHQNMQMFLFRWNKTKSMCWDWEKENTMDWSWGHRGMVEIYDHLRLYCAGMGIGFSCDHDFAEHDPVARGSRYRWIMDKIINLN
jgi:hypothetical protein